MTTVTSLRLQLLVASPALAKRRRALLSDPGGSLRRDHRRQPRWLHERVRRPHQLSRGPARRGAHPAGRGGPPGHHRHLRSGA